MPEESQDAPLVTITFTADVDSPPSKAGKKGETRQIEQHWAEQLVTNGYAQYAGVSE